MKNALILHGAGNNSQGNWFPWLKKELEQKGYKVWAPDLPDSDMPNQQKWLEVIFSNSDWEFNSESVIVGHSSGATFILRILEILPERIAINKAILVSAFLDQGTKPEFFSYKQDLLKQTFNWKKIKDSAKHFYFIASDNDPYQCGQEHAQKLQENLGGELIIQPGQGHFNLEVGEEYRKFPLLLKLIS